MTYLEKRWENNEQITSWVVKPNKLFSSRPVFTGYLICWAYRGYKTITDYYLAIGTERMTGQQLILDETKSH